MVVSVGELWEAIKLLPALGTLIDAGIEIDDVGTRCARCREMDDDIASRIEAARITHVGVVVSRDVDVVVLGPTHAFEVNRDRRSDRT